MNILVITFLAILGLLVLIMLWGVWIYNNVVRQSNLVAEGWSGIDVQLRRRSDLIPNLVSTVKGYSIHEKDVLERVTQLRATAMGAQTVEEKAAAEQELTAALKTLFAVAENYPNLKANENFLQLQQELSALENEIQLARRYYNGAVRNYNVAIQRFPANLLAHIFGFDKKNYFETDASSRETPRVDF